MDRDSIDMILEQWKSIRPDLDASSMEVIDRLSRASRLSSLGVQKDLRPQGLETWEFDVLLALRGSVAKSPLSPGSLASLCMVSPSAMTNRLNRLFVRGLIRRETDPENRRQQLISLTQEGVALVDVLVVHHEANLQRMLHGLTVSERLELASLLGKFLRNNGLQDP